MMNSCNKQNKQLTASAWLSVLLVVASMLCATSNVIAHQQRINILPQNSSAGLDPFSGLPTQKEILSTIVDEKIKQIVAQLDSPDFTRREEATRQLVSENISRRQICKVLLANDLSSEQRHRLVDWLRSDLKTTPHAAIGIRIVRRKMNEEIVVEALIEDLPAIEVLEPGDKVVALDGLTITHWEQFLQSISSRKPGDKVTVTVKRSTKRNANIDDQKSEMQELNFELILGSDDYLINEDGTKQVNSLIRGALNRDLITIVNRYGPKILRIRTTQVPKSDTGASEAKEK